MWFKMTTHDLGSQYGHSRKETDTLKVWMQEKSMDQRIKELISCGTKYAASLLDYGVTEKRRYGAAAVFIPFWSETVSWDRKTLPLWLTRKATKVAESYEGADLGNVTYRPINIPKSTIEKAKPCSGSL